MHELAFTVKINGTQRSPTLWRVSGPQKEEAPKQPPSFFIPSEPFRGDEGGRISPRSRKLSYLPLGLTAYGRDPASALKRSPPLTFQHNLNWLEDEPTYRTGESHTTTYANHTKHQLQLQVPCMEMQELVSIQEIEDTNKSKFRSPLEFHRTKLDIQCLPIIAVLWVRQGFCKHRESCPWLQLRIFTTTTTNHRYVNLISN